MDRRRLPKRCRNPLRACSEVCFRNWITVNGGRGSSLECQVKLKAASACVEVSWMQEMIAWARLLQLGRRPLCELNSSTVKYNRRQNLARMDDHSFLGNFKCRAPCQISKRKLAPWMVFGTVRICDGQSVPTVTCIDGRIENNDSSKV